MSSSAIEKFGNDSNNRIETLNVLTLRDTIPVEILYVDSPTNIWLRPTDMKHQYESMVMSMLEYYWDQGKGTIVATDDLIPGTVCAIRTKTTIRRGRIIYVDDDGCAEVWLIDFGSSDFYHISQIYYLESVFYEIPVTAIQCGLADVQPSSLDWCDSAQRYICDSSFGEICTANLHTRVIENNTIWIKLSIQDRDVGSELIWEGDALPHRQRLRSNA